MNRWFRVVLVLRPKDMVFAPIESDVLYVSEVLKNEI